MVRDYEITKLRIKNIVFIVGLNGKKKFISKAKKLSETKPIKEIKLKS